MKIATKRIEIQKLECELTDAYLHVHRDKNEMLFHVNVVSRYEFVMNMLGKKSIELLFQ